MASCSVYKVGYSSQNLFFLHPFLHFTIGNCIFVLFFLLNYRGLHFSPIHSGRIETFHVSFSEVFPRMFSMQNIGSYSSPACLHKYSTIYQWHSAPWRLDINLFPFFYSPISCLLPLRLFQKFNSYSTGCNRLRRRPYRTIVHRPHPHYKE